jgi:hypothetical protein
VQERPPDTEEARLDQAADEAREQMLRGEDTIWSDRQPHRGEQAYTPGGDYIDPADQAQGGMSGGGTFGTSGANQGSVSPRDGGPTGPHKQDHQGVAPGAFGEETGGPDAIRTADNTRDKAVEKLQGLES